MNYKVNKRTSLKKVFSWLYCGIKNRVDYIIVGQGLAGSCLALQLIDQGKNILVFDEPENNRATAVAAGLFNPVTGKYLKQSWVAEKLFPSLFQFYKGAEELLGKRFFYPMPIYRPFVSIEEQNEWMAQSESNSLKKFISKVHTTQAFNGQVNDSFGGVVTEYSGYLDTMMFMGAIREFLKSQNAYMASYFDFEKIIIENEKIIYGNIEATKIIFCDGVGLRANPYFKWVPVNSLKGETLTIFLQEAPDAIFNRGVYVVPTRDEKLFMVGATYNPNDSTQDVSVSAKMELEEKLRDLIKIPFTVSHQNWGMRPTSPDRKPIIGPHPEYGNLVIFNGLGTKGVSLAPYFSSHLASWLEGRGEIVPEVNIGRFKSLYSKFSSAKI